MMRRFALILFAAILCAALILSQSACQLFGKSGGRQQVLNLYSIDPVTLDPAIAGEATSHQYIMQIFSGLVRLDDSLKPVPDIAEKWQVSRDGRTYTFTLRKNVRFHSGREVKAQDFAYSWRRAADPATGSLTAATYLGDIVGMKEVLTGRSQQIAGIRVIDDYTLQVTIDTPKVYFLSKLTYPTAFVVDRANVGAGEDWWARPNGTGPFRLKQWDKNSLIVLEKNPLYYDKPAGLDSVVYQLYSGVPMNLYETSRIDVTGFGTDYIDRVTDEKGPFRKEMAVYPELSFFYIGFDVTRPPFDDINVRRAFYQAINREKIAILTFRNMVQKAEGILPPGIPAFNKALTGLAHDPETAKRWLAASKYGDASKLPPITITTAGLGGGMSQDLEAIVQEWRLNLGVEVTVRQLEPERFTYVLKEERDEMFVSGWIADYPHPQDFLEVLFHTGADYNFGEYSNPEVDAMLDQAGTEPDTERSLALYQKAEQKIVDDVAVIPLWFGKNYILVKPYVNGYKLNALGYPSLANVTIAPP
ncbi:MAG: peptide ABC transporter substrate-binding protein [Chloroflexi bacterium]|nr:peptide ABC transporter substrate-binding protein [Chloroflexota bacterium]